MEIVGEDITNFKRLSQYKLFKTQLDLKVREYFLTLKLNTLVYHKKISKRDNKEGIYYQSLQMTTNPYEESLLSNILFILLSAKYSNN
jgi:hypothetical protein